MLPLLVPTLKQAACVVCKDGKYLEHNIIVKLTQEDMTDHSPSSSTWVKSLF